jgi:hypothetical protein
LRELRIAIGGVTVAIVSRETDLDLGLHGPHVRFAATNVNADITVEARWETAGAANTSPAAGARIFDSGGVWQLYREGDLLSFHLHAPKFGRAPYAKATFSADFTNGVVQLRRDCFDPSVPHYPLDYPLDELLITNWLALGRGVEVHACGVLDGDGAGYLFAGYSGAGKTTSARLWCKENGVQVLSDDRIILRKVGNDVWMHGTPWHGDEPLASPACALVQRGFILHHGSQNRVTQIAATQAVMELFARSFPPFFSRRGLEFTLSVLTEISDAIPVFTLQFVPDERLPTFVRST